MVILDFLLLSSEQQCHQANYLLLEKNLFLRLYELRKEFSYLIKRGTNKNEVVHDLSRCVKERFNRFDIDKIYKREKKEEFQVIAIVYQPAKKI